MTKEERGALLVEKENLEKVIANATALMRKYGGLLQTIGQQLVSSPDIIIFSNTPMNLGSYPPDTHSSGHDWNKVPTKEDIAQLSFSLKASQKALKEVELKLNQK